MFYPKAHTRLFKSPPAADASPAPARLRRALDGIDRHISAFRDKAGVENTA